jgi:hypothetical protein
MHYQFLVVNGRGEYNLEEVRGSPTRHRTRLPALKAPVGHHSCPFIECGGRGGKRGAVVEGEGEEGSFNGWSGGKTKSYSGRRSRRVCFGFAEFYACI